MFSTLRLVSHNSSQLRISGFLLLQTPSPPPPYSSTDDVPINRIRECLMICPSSSQHVIRQVKGNRNHSELEISFSIRTRAQVYPNPFFLALLFTIRFIKNETHQKFQRVHHNWVGTEVHWSLMNH